MQEQFSVHHPAYNMVEVPVAYPPYGQLGHMESRNCDNIRALNLRRQNCRNCRIYSRSTCKIIENLPEVDHIASH